MFLNALMLAGVAAAVLPVVLHLLSRSRYRSVDWGAMMFLDGADANQERRSRLNQWVLLLVRTALIALLAIALARPVVQGRHAAPARGQRVTAVLLLDCSASMGYDENGHSRMVLAKGAARQILGLHRGDRVSLLLMGRDQPAAERQPTGDLWDVARRIDAADPGYGRANVAEALTDALDAVEAREARDAGERPRGAPADKPFLRFYVITDRQASSWNEVDDKFRSTWQARLQRDGLGSRLFVVPVGGTDADNVAVDSIELLNAPAVAGQPIELEVRLRNYGPVQWASLPLTVSADRRVVAEQKVNLAPDSAASVTVSLKRGFPEPGTHVITAEINRQGTSAAAAAGAPPAPAGAPGSARPAGYVGDDRLETVIEVIEPVKVLVVTGDEQAAATGSGPPGPTPGPGGLRGEADYLQLALAPFKAARREAADLTAVDVVPAGAWDGPTVALPKRGGEAAPREARLGAYQVVVLANVERLTARQVQAVEQFVYDGGGLLVAPGNLVRPADYNEALYRDGSGVLPAALREATPDDGSEETTLSGFDAHHPVFRFLNGRPDLFLPAVVSRHFPVERFGSSTRALAHYVSGDPFLLEAQMPRGGRVLLVTTSLDADWSTLPLTNFYLPFVQSAVRYLASASHLRTNLLPGQPIEVPFDDPAPPQGRTVRVTAPDGQDHPAEILHPGDQAVARFADTEQPGRYDVRVTEPGRKSYTLHFVVRPPRDESDLTPLSPDRWAWLESALAAERVDPADRPLTASPVASLGTRELWAWLMGTVLLLAVLETALARRFSRDPDEEGGGEMQNAE